VGIQLQPTLWRTCRVLAHRERLRIFLLLIRQNEMSVSEVADALKRPLSEASEYLRSLNARGLLAVRRSGKFVYYRIGSDSSLPDSAQLLESVTRRCKEPGNAVQDVYRNVTALTHPRRIIIIRLLAERPLSPEALRVRIGASYGSIWRHLNKLKVRGFIEKNGRQYRLARPSDDLRQTLLHLAMH